MGQAYKAVNFTKKETLCPSTVGCMLKLMENAYVGNYFVDAVYELLGGPWRGDEVAVVGDYAWGDASQSEVEWLRKRCGEDPYVGEGFKDASGLWRVKPDETTDVFRSIGGELGIPDRELGSEEAALASIVRSLSLSAFDVVSWRHPAGAVLDSRGLAARIVWKEGAKGAGIEIFRKPKPAPRYLANLDRRVFVDRGRQPVCGLGGDGIVWRYDALVLFLAVGNGLGGGDYCPRGGAGEREIGTWKGESVRGLDEPPEGFKEISSPFDEEGIFLTATDEELQEVLSGLPDRSQASVQDVKRAWNALASSAC